MDPADAVRRWEKAVSHLKFTIELYRIQLEAGRLFLHEHPAHATSWNIPEMIELMSDRGWCGWWRTSACMAK